MEEDKEEKVGRDKKTKKQKNKIKEERKKERKKELCWICLNEDLVFFVDIPSIQPISLSLILPIFFSFLVCSRSRKKREEKGTDHFREGVGSRDIFIFFLI